MKNIFKSLKDKFSRPAAPSQAPPFSSPPGVIEKLALLLQAMSPAERAWAMVNMSAGLQHELQVALIEAQEARGGNPLILNGVGPGHEAEAALEAIRRKAIAKNIEHQREDARLKREADLLLAAEGRIVAEKKWLREKEAALARREAALAEREAAAGVVVGGGPVGGGAGEEGTDGEVAEKVLVGRRISIFGRAASKRRRAGGVHRRQGSGVSVFSHTDPNAGGGGAQGAKGF
ncbi:hypothetical protein EDC01DRAFT_781486 [Geopyxis carbonaria]|nr:hypothetical protein EDC01DRAFT_781486 [Geopyxis carbonaria]